MLLKFDIRITDIDEHDIAHFADRVDQALRHAGFDEWDGTFSVLPIAATPGSAFSGRRTRIDTEPTTPQEDQQFAAFAAEEPTP